MFEKPLKVNLSSKILKGILERQGMHVVWIKIEYISVYLGQILEYAIA